MNKSKHFFSFRVNGHILFIYLLNRFTALHSSQLIIEQVHVSSENNERLVNQGSNLYNRHQHYKHILNNRPLSLSLLYIYIFYGKNTLLSWTQILGTKLDLQLYNVTCLVTFNKLQISVLSAFFLILNTTIGGPGG